jgi:hypothetical protein
MDVNDVGPGRGVLHDIGQVARSSMRLLAGVGN